MTGGTAARTVAITRKGASRTQTMSAANPDTIYQDIH